MNTFKLKIKPKYIEPIKNGTKCREYRLANDERRSIRIGDILILINNQDRYEYVKVVVTSIEKYDNWEEPLKKYWEEDFKDNFDSYEECLNECHRFYSRGQIEQYGVNVFGIKPLYKELKNSDVLLDTNIIIRRESSNNVAYEIMQLYKTLDNLKVNKYLLGDIKKEIKKHKSKDVVENMLSKINSYNFLNDLEIADDSFLNQIRNYRNDENSIIDNKYLYQVYKGNVDYLITDDKGILQKASDLYLSDCVLSSTDFLKLVEKKCPSFIEYKALSIKLKKISSLNLDDSFFDTLKIDYGNLVFTRWLHKKATDGEKAYVFEKNSILNGFLYLKIENENEDYSDIRPVFKPKRRIKIGTFKINSTGLRVGERFLKIIFDYALKSSAQEIYVTMFENKRPEIDALKKFLNEWGFEKHGIKNSTGEIVLVKKIGTYDLSKTPKYNYPNLKKGVQYGILPIDANYHTDLFPDLYLNNEDMSLFEEKPCGYAIEKIYITASRSVAVEKGDLMIIYRMSDRLYKTYSSVVSGICEVQEVIKAKTYEEFLEICKNRSVFDESMLYENYHILNRKTIVKVLFIKPLEKKIILKDLMETGIINEKGPRISNNISESGFVKLLEMGGVEIQ